MSWLKFFIIYVIIFMLFNLIFGVFYWLDPEGISNTDGSFFKYFSFSVQTFSTVGYGLFAPMNFYSNALVVIESLLGVLFTALLTGLAFAKFSKPTARIQFTDKVVITTFQGKKTMMFRMANLRGNHIAEASVKAAVLMAQNTPEGHSMRIQKDIRFVRSASSFFILPWTVMHVIDEASPLFNLTPQEIIDNNIEMSVSVVGHDETFSQTVHMSGIYSCQDFIFERNFEDIVINQNGRATAVDFSKFDLLKPLN